MTHILTLKLPDEVVQSLRHAAVRTGQSLESLAEDYLRQRAEAEQEKREALERLKRFAGCFSLGRPLGTDNEQIDADLAREYLNTHDDEVGPSGADR